MNIPSESQCLKLMTEMKMMDHIVRHSLQVCRVAMYIAGILANTGMKLNRPMIGAAALLHDITKTRSFDTGENHAETGAAYASDKGYREVGEIIRQHVVLDAYFPAQHPSEAEVVNYADKRVLHDNVVPLNIRMNYIMERYGKTDEDHSRIQKLWGKTLELEDRLFRHMDCAPDELSRVLGGHDQW